MPRPTVKTLVRTTLALTALAAAGLAGSAVTSGTAEAHRRIYVGFYRPVPLFRVYRAPLLVTRYWAPCPWNVYRLCRY